MDISSVMTAATVVGGTGLFIGLFLGFAGKKFAVKVDEKEEAILGALPGNNCGGCGYPGCAGLAEAIAKGEAPVNGCPVGGEPVGKRIAEIMGVEAGEKERMTAFVKCAGDCDKAGKEYVYTGIETCTMAALAQDGGDKACAYGCLGYGTCVDVCPFDAIHVVNGVAVVDKEACKACGKCIAACPKHLIELVPYKQKHLVQCSSQDKGKTLMDACSVGCIGCTKCVRSCPFDAVHMEGHVAKIDYDVCKDCGKCARECPRNIIL